MIVSGGHFAPGWGDHFRPDLHGHFKGSSSNLGIVFNFGQYV